MALPENPVSGGYRLTNPGNCWVDRWTCPACYADHEGSDGLTVDCSCGARLKLTIEHEPICVAECIDPDEEERD
jgi:hypothetical protein